MSIFTTFSLQDVEVYGAPVWVYFERSCDRTQDLCKYMHFRYMNYGCSMK